MIDPNEVHPDYKVRTAKDGFLAEVLNNPPEASYGLRYEVFQVLARDDDRHFTVIFKLRRV